MLEPRRGAFALCSKGLLGLILSDGPEEIIYPDGTKGRAWTGIHLTGADKLAEGSNAQFLIGSPKWSSRRPIVIGYAGEVVDALDLYRRRQLGAKPDDMGYATMLEDLLPCVGEMGWGDNFVQNLCNEWLPKRPYPLTAKQKAKIEEFHEKHCC